MSAKGVGRQGAGDDGRTWVMKMGWMTSRLSLKADERKR
jgi:hypothetical protein